MIVGILEELEELKEGECGGGERVERLLVTRRLFTWINLA